MRGKLGHRIELVEWYRSGQVGPWKRGEDLSDIRIGEIVRKGLRPGECLFLWSEEDVLPLPSVVVVGEGEVQDFWAWISTYLTGSTSILRFCRVISDKLAMRIWSWAMPSARIHGNYAAMNLMVRTITGLVLGEAGAEGRRVSSSRLDGVLEGLLSFVLGRALVVGYQVEDLREVDRRFSWIEETFRERNLPVSAYEEVRDVFYILVELFEHLKKGGRLSNKPEIELLTDVIENGDVGQSAWRRTVGDPGLPVRVRAMADGTLEDRVTLLQESDLDFVRSLDFRRRGLVLGYLFSRVRPGTFRHQVVLKEIAGESMSVLLWYGVFAGLHPNSEILIVEEGSLVAFALSRAFRLLDRPVGTASFWEVSLASSKGAKGRKPEYSHRDIEKIELLPGVTCEFPGGGRDRQLGLFRAEQGKSPESRQERRMRMLLDEASRSLEECRRIFRTMSGEGGSRSGR